MKSISWKQSIIVVVLLHGFAYLAISQYSKYKTTLAKQLKETREALYSNTTNKQEEWPRSKAKPIVVQAPIKIPQQKIETKPSSIVIDKKTVKNIVKNVQNVFSSQFEKKEPKPIKTVKKPLSYYPTVKSTPTPKPKNTNTVYSSTRKFESNPQSAPIPIKRAIPVTSQIQNIPIQEPVIENIPEITEYTINGQKYQDTTQTVQRVVRTYVVVQ
jgi:hypothetical protein